ncbi:hypothetical protein BJY14_007295 [Actinomadura luteofluorescens]|uniref:Uncharacterized protein n=1 Tax=Actinomadura luteofluorescens TaxID=46163 RepID=A0A7Y9EP07_9ACTN|nr:hypothetical protein [Actinomadura luteofluorescens]NYD51312.1 hypothetical protein [Actinomadura luteofluorescens]
MKRTVLNGLLAIAVGALAGVCGGGLVEHLLHTSYIAEIAHAFGGAPAGSACSGFLADVVGPGLTDRFVAGAVGGFAGFIGAVVRSAYRAAYGAAVPRDDCGRLVAGGLVLAAVFGVAGLVSVGGFGLLAAITVIGGFAAGAVVGDAIADV